MIVMWLLNYLENNRLYMYSSRLSSILVLSYVSKTKTIFYGTEHSGIKQVKFIYIHFLQ